MPDILQLLIPIVVGGMFVLALLLFVVALWYFRRGKRDPYWRLRRAASLHGWQLFLISLTMAFVASGICLFSGLATAILEPGGNTGTPLQGSVAAPLTVIGDTPIANDVTATPLFDVTIVTAPPEVSPTVRVTATQTPANNATTAPTTTAVTIMPTRSPIPRATDLIIQPLVSDVTPLPEAKLIIAALDDDITADWQPVQATDQFAVGVTRIYFWVDYAQMSHGLSWERQLLFEDVVVQGDAYLWNAGEAGTAVYFWGDGQGFPPGAYEIHLSLAGELVAEQSFIVE